MIDPRRPDNFASYTLFACDLILVLFLAGNCVDAVIADLIAETPLTDTLFIMTATWLILIVLFHLVLRNFIFDIVDLALSRLLVDLTTTVTKGPKCST